MQSSLQNVFHMLDVDILNRISEIRFRRGGYIVIVIKNTSYFMDYNGDLYNYPSAHCAELDGESFDELFLSLCSYSLYNNMDSLKNGYITLENGARVGVASSAVYEDGALIAVKEVTSLNIRIPREVKGCSDTILNFLYVNAFPSIIVAGRPNSGKTTLLRDMTRRLSSGFNNRYAKLAVIDERNELCGKRNGSAVMDLGVNTDVLTAFSKARGIEIATRTLSPEMIVCDEVSTEEEVRSILYAFSSGISFALSVHISAREDLLRKPVMKTLLGTQEFSYIVLLDNYTYQPEIIEASEVYREICRNGSADTLHNGTGITFI